MAARLRRDQQRGRRSHLTDVQGGSGWLLLAPFIIVPAILLPGDSIIRYGLWFAGITSALYGLWRVRRDSVALRGWGIFFGLVTGCTFAYLGVQAMGSDTGPNIADVGVVTPATAQAGPQVAENDAAPVAGVFEIDVIDFRGDAEHSGIQPGPVPTSNQKLAWRFDTGGEVYSTPVLAKGILYVASKTGDLFAIDAATGSERWRLHISDYVVRSSPSVFDGVVYIGAGFSLHAVDAESGVERWQTSMRYAGQSTATVRDGLVIVSSQEEWLYAFDATTGELRWRIPTDGVVFGAAAVTSDRVVIGTDKGTVYAVKLDSGEMLWRKSVDGGVVATPTVADGTVYFTSDRGKTFAYSLDAGKVLWTAEVGGKEPVSVTKDLVVIAASDGGIHALRRSDGSPVWLYPTGQQALAAPATVASTVVIGAGNSLLTIDGTTGTLDGYFLANGAIATTPLIVNGYIFFGSADGFLYALHDESSGP